MSLCDGVIGNSSSGLLEAPTLKKGTVNIGNRQHGRLQAASIINCEPDRVEIKMAIEQLYSPEFQEGLANVRNPYGDGGASDRVLALIKQLQIEVLTLKAFYDLPIAASAPGENQ